MKLNLLITILFFIQVTIAGTIVDVGLGKINADDIPEIIESKDRTRAGKTLPPHGLYLLEVQYDV